MKELEKNLWNKVGMEFEGTEEVAYGRNLEVIGQIPPETDINCEVNEFKEEIVS